MFNLFVCIFCVNLFTNYYANVHGAKDLGCYMIQPETKILDKIDHVKEGHLDHRTCTEGCSQHNTAYAGVENGKHCYCGNTIPSHLSRTLPSECNVTCPGNSKQTCGGHNRMNIFLISSTIPISSLTNCIYIGCYKDDVKDDTVFKGTRHLLEKLTIHQCHKKCHNEGYLHFALSQNNCTCGDRLISAKHKVQDEKCSTECPGDPVQKCGAPQHISLYSTGITDIPARIHYQGCYSEQYAANLMTGYEINLQYTNSPRRCLNMCLQRGFKYASVKQKFCYCSDELPRDDSLQPFIQCTLLKCPGDFTETCGGDDFLKTYVTKKTEEKHIFQDYYGCFAEDQRNLMMGDAPRIFSSNLISDECSEYCKLREFAFAGTDGHKCFCGHNVPPSITKLTGTDCDSPCFKESPFRCDVRRPFLTFTSGLQPLDIPNSVYIGCFREASGNKNNTNTRLLSGHWLMHFSLTPQFCHYTCFKYGHLFFGLSEGSECYCGDNEPYRDSMTRDTECNKLCNGDGNYNCGGSLRTAVYRTGINDVPTVDRYVGCYLADDTNTILSEYRIDLGYTNSPRRCLNLCDILGYNYAGVTKKKTCRCGFETPSKEYILSEGKCSIYKCESDFSEACGGDDGATRIYKTRHISSTEPSRKGGYLGCFADQSTNRLLNGVRESFPESFVPNYCTQICTHRGFAFAGVTEGTDCYCGYNNPSYASKVPERECNVSCAGHPDVLCGGKQRLAIYYTGLHTLDIEASTYMGCFKEDSAIRTKSWFENRLLSDLFITAAQMKKRNCHSLCHKHGFLYFGLTERSICFCGNLLPSKKIQVKEGECHFSCEGNVNEKCGAESRFNVYATGITDMNLIGHDSLCYDDQEDSGGLRGYKIHLAATNSHRRCANICFLKGFRYSGVKGGSYCYCDHEGVHLRTIVSNDHCKTKKCPGNKTESCGSKKNILVNTIDNKKGVFAFCDPRFENCDSSVPLPDTFPLPVPHVPQPITERVEPITPTPTPTVTTDPGIPNPGSCMMPQTIPGRVCSIAGCTAQSTDSSCHASPGSYVNPSVLMTCSCQPHYTLSTESEKAYCVNGIWFPKTPECARLCDPLKSTTLDLVLCEHNGVRVSCTDPAKPNTTVTVRCKPTYIPESPSLAVRSVTCLSTGIWDQTLHTCKPECGQGFPGVVTLLSGAKPSAPDDMPWHVAIYRKVNPNTGQLHEYLCGGSVISPVLILSAAHCFCESTTNKKYNATEFEVAVGKYTVNYNILDSPHTKIINVKNLFIPDSYFGEELFYASDIALLELTDSITISNKVMPICIDWFPTDSKPPTVGKVAGWGYTETGNVSDVLLVADLPFLTQNECRAMVNEWFRRFVSQPDKFCAGTKSGAGARPGDSGGGWMYKHDEHYYVYGIVSFKETVETSVATFTKISSHLDWMDRIRKQISFARGV